MRTRKPTNTNRLTQELSQAFVDEALAGKEETVELKLDSETVTFLRTIGDPTIVLRQLARCAALGMKQPSSWMRGWVTECLGCEWDDALEADPLHRGLMRPKEKKHDA